jgi:hypothetical protein
MFAIVPSFDYESKRVKRLLRDSASVGWAKTASRNFVAKRPYVKSLLAPDGSFSSACPRNAAKQIHGGVIVLQAIRGR